MAGRGDRGVAVQKPKAADSSHREGRKEARRALSVERRAAKRLLLVQRQAARKAEKEERRAERKAGIKTRGGNQCWQDRVVVDDHRIQQHVLLKHHRVLNAVDRRLHTGASFEDAHAALAPVIAATSREASHLVVLMHGYGGNKRRMLKLRDAARAAGFAAESVQYPSLLRDLDEIAAAIAELVVASSALHQGRIKEVSLVAFSMGGLVAKRVVMTLKLRSDAPKLVQLVTIGTPHLGSPLASLPAWLRVLGGPNVAELMTKDESAVKVLPVRLGVVGGRGVRNHWTIAGVLGDGDGVVELTSAIVEGAVDSLVVKKVKHTKLPTDPKVVAAVVRFLKHGRFEASRNG